MSGTTSRFAFPYPSPSDPVKEGAAKIAAFAEGADAAILDRSYGKSIITTQESRENTAFGKMPTADEVTVVLPENGLIAVAFHGMWQQFGAGTAKAAIFIGANQLKSAVWENFERTRTPGSVLEGRIWRHIYST